MPVDYFMENLTLHEAADIINNLEYVDRNDRELKRYELYVAIQSNSKHKIALKDVFSLPWDKMTLDNDIEEYDEEKEKQMDEKTSQMLNLLNNGCFKVTAANLI